jgi:hypothetical protein
MTREDPLQPVLPHRRDGASEDALRESSSRGDSSVLITGRTFSSCSQAVTFFRNASAKNWRGTDAAGFSACTITTNSGEVSALPAPAAASVATTPRRACNTRRRVGARRRRSMRGFESRLSIVVLRSRPSFSRAASPTP